MNAVLTLHAAFIHKIRHRNLSAIYLLNATTVNRAQNVNEILIFEN
jgi:hypothetical protein